MVKVVICNGRPMSGKTTFQKLCMQLCYTGNSFWFDEYKPTMVEICSTVDFVKQIATECGWDGTKTPHNRKFLSDLKDLLTQWDDVPYHKILERIDTLSMFGLEKNDWILFVDCREPTEIQKLKERLNGTTLLIRRLGDVAMETSNHADANVFDYEYDYVVENYGELSDLLVKAEMFLDYMKERDYFEFEN